MNGIPTESNVYQYVHDASFADGFSSLTGYKNQSALEVYLALIQKTPTWVNRLMSIRNNVVAKLGLKNLGHLADINPNKLSSDYKVGDRVGIFTLSVIEHNEVVFHDTDKHLKARISLFIEANGNTAKVSLNTVVHVHNTLGKVYMFFVGPVHKIIVPSILKQLPKI